MQNEMAVSMTETWEHKLPLYMAEYICRNDMTFALSLTTPLHNDDGFISLLCMGNNHLQLLQVTLYTLVLSI